MKAPLVRCAIYTRKSTEEGLDQGFNSLDAQREACEAYVLSQAGEGWSALKDRYDDGGFSGGSMERPALNRLLADIAAGRVDTVVVYKIDRLTRSLNDFARIVDVLDKAGASFVSVTQAFNTTTSMGRLTLNVLLSFAQFEREVTGERIRDKIAASKARGLWMGGNPPLGYDPPADKTVRVLTVNEAEAAVVRRIFSLYLETESVNLLQRRLREDGVRSKAWVSTRGRAVGGLAFSSGALLHLLKNRIYLGEIVHGDKAYPGQHAAIVDQALFDAVQAGLSQRSAVRRHKHNGGGKSPLAGLIFDTHGRPMSPTISYGRGGRCYRYYVSAPLQKGATRDEDDTLARLPAQRVDEVVFEVVGRLARQAQTPITLRTVLRRVVIHRDHIELVLDRSGLGIPLRGLADSLAAVDRRLAAGETATSDPHDDGLVRITVPVLLRSRGGRSWLTLADGKSPDGRPRQDPTLIWGLSRGHSAVSTMGLRPDGRPILGKVRKPAASAYERAIATLAFLAPDIQEAIVSGRQPIGLKLEYLLKTKIPLAWADQRQALGF